MRIASKDVPQADKLSVVVRLIEAIENGARTYQEIAKAINMVERQGRYYRRAAEILRLIVKVEGENCAVLTSTGWELARSTGVERTRILKAAVLNTEMFQLVLSFLSSKGTKGVSRAEVRRFIEDVTEPVGPSMIPRRVATALGWLAEIGMLREEDGKYWLE